MAESLGCSVKNGEQGWGSGESTHLPPVWPGIDSRILRHMWVEFVGSLLCSERFFLGTSVYPSPQKPTVAGVAQLASVRHRNKGSPVRSSVTSMSVSTFL